MNESTEKEIKHLKVCETFFVFFILNRYSSGLSSAYCLTAPKW